jgi:hypothetical protein
MTTSIYHTTIVPDNQTDRVQEEGLRTNDSLSPHQPAAARDRLEPARCYTTADNQPRQLYPHGIPFMLGPQFGIDCVAPELLLWTLGSSAEVR